MTNPDDLHARLEKLEVTVAYQEQVIEDLNATLARQANEMDALNRQVAKLVAQLESLSAHPALDGQNDPPPPHY